MRMLGWNGVLSSISFSAPHRCVSSCTQSRDRQVSLHAMRGYVSCVAPHIFKHLHHVLCKCTNVYVIPAADAHACVYVDLAMNECTSLCLGTYWLQCYNDLCVLPGHVCSVVRRGRSSPRRFWRHTTSLTALCCTSASTAQRWACCTWVDSFLIHSACAYTYKLISWLSPTEQCHELKDVQDVFWPPPAALG